MTQNQMPKIHATWPPGCYGSYVIQSIYAYSNLSTASEIIIDPTGSSHTFRDSDERKKYFEYDNDLSDKNDIIIGPDHGHELDYFVNQFTKTKNQFCKTGDIREYVEHLFPGYKLKFTKNWSIKEEWATREWISFWILDFLTTGYKHNDNCNVLVSKLFDENEDVFPMEITRLIKKLGLSVVADIDTIKINHQKWKTHQRFHNLQKRCDKWISDIINTHEDMPSPCITILDEAYVQNRLRSYGYEIRCFELNVFPKTSNELRSLLYKES